ncbi:hypothetical protein HAZT_HAZT007632 [Hyalella azteca]|uniref:Uncharacterized protein n=1 Tax=Hyalella azteca TaxID=294128 RepID=A0A6A0H4E4_HYAAZ|nr:hypothetical protein HAZT_HAZT007632 [Hyalella azteca]
MGMGTQRGYRGGAASPVGLHPSVRGMPNSGMGGGMSGGGMGGGGGMSGSMPMMRSGGGYGGGMTGAAAGADGGGAYSPSHGGQGSPVMYQGQMSQYRRPMQGPPMSGQL